MDSVRADQLIFANVEAEQSPAGKRGFQTILLTQGGFTAEDMYRIEERLFYVPGSRQVDKHVFFGLGDARFVVARVVACEGTDRFGRGGRYLAHALAFSARDFGQLGNNPFRVFRRFPFLDTVEQALSVGDLRSGSIEPAKVEVPDAAAGGSSTDFDPREFLPLLLLACQARALSEERRPLAFVGNPAAMFELLEGLFSVLPSAVRRDCWFDTVFSEGSVGRIPCFAIGLPPGEPKPQGSLVFDLEGARFQGVVDVQPPHLFARWVKQVAETNRGAARRLSLQGDAAFVMASWLEGAGSRSSSALPEQGDSALFGELRALGGDLIEQRLRDALTTKLGAGLTQRIEDEALALATEGSHDLMSLLNEGFPLSRIAGWLRRSLEDVPSRPSRQELDDLELFVAREPEPFLKACWLRWTRNWRDLSSFLSAADRDELKRFAAWSLRTVYLCRELAVDDRGVGLQLSVSLRFDDGEPDPETIPLVKALLGITPDRPEQGGPSAGGNQDDGKGSGARGEDEHARGLFGLIGIGGRRKEPDGPPPGEAPGPEKKPVRTTAADPQRWLVLMEVLVSHRGGRRPEKPRGGR